MSLDRHAGVFQKQSVVAGLWGKLMRQILVAFTLGPFFLSSCVSKNHVSAVNARTLDAQQDWNFTPGDFRRLISSGGRLTVADDSAWMPEAVSDHVLASLTYILGEQDGIQRTIGINEFDAYHGHFLCRKPCPPDTEEAGKLLEQNWRDDLERAYGMTFEHFLPLSQKDIPALTSVLSKREKETGQMLARSLIDGSCPEPTTLYHTYEHNLPGDMKYGDPRRNILAPMGQLPYGYNPGDASSNYSTVYCSLLRQFVFLIDKNGRVISPSELDFVWLKSPDAQ